LNLRSESLLTSAVLGNVFEITNKESNESYTLFTASKEEKEEWIEAIRVLLPDQEQDISSSSKKRKTLNLKQNKRETLSALQSARITKTNSDIFKGKIIKETPPSSENSNRSKNKQNSSQTSDESSK
jgi:hypothetical protein